VSVATVNTSDRNRETALALAANGAFVFPCQGGAGPTGKQPVPGMFWRSSATTDADEINRWWNRWPRAAPAIDQGRSGFFVIDCDVAKDHGEVDGLPWFTALAESHDYDISDVPGALTPSGGRHLYFRQPDGESFGNSRGGLPPKKECGVDVRGKGGYCIAPGAVMGEDRTYQPLGDLSEAPPMPDWLIALMRAPIPEPPPAVAIAPAIKAAPSSASPARIASYAQAAIDAEAATLRGAVTGERNNTLNTVAFKFGQMVGAGWLSEAEAHSILEAGAADIGLVKDDGIRSVRATIRSGLRSGIKEPRKEPADRPSDGNDYGLSAWIERDGELFNPDTGEVATVEGAPSLAAEPFVWCDPAAIPRRQWLYGRHFIRQFISATIAPGGVGKSSLLIAEALAMASGRDLFGEPVRDDLRAWLFNLEDPRDELQRRVTAAMLYHDIAPREIDGRLFINSGRQTPLVIAEESREGVRIVVPVVEALKREIIYRKIDVLIVDPFVASHRIGENDNQRIDQVVSTWAAIADQTNCAVELVHHARKTGGAEVTAEDARGAGSLVAKARSVRAINRMSKEEASQLGVGPEDAVRLIRIDSGAKANLAPPATQATWRQLASVPLGNGDPDALLDDQDWVGVVAGWQRPNHFDGVTVQHLIEVQKVIAGQGFRKDAQAADWVGRPVARVLGLDLESAADKAKVKSILKIWLGNGALVETVGKDKARRTRTVIDVGEWADK
jgi:hypothetical protein